MEPIDVLKKTRLFKGAKEKELSQVAGFGKVKEYRAGETIFEEGEEGQEFYVVIEGSVAINKNIAGGRKRNLSNLNSNEVFGELALFDAEPRSADAEAIVDTTLLVLDNKKLRELLKNNLVLAFIVQTRLIRILCKRLRATDDMLKEGVIWGFSMDL